MTKINVKNGDKYGKLVVISDVQKIKGYRKVLCRCVCGKSKLIQVSSLNSGETKSCGCLQKQRASQANKTHGFCGTATYRAWRHMWSRCTNKNVRSYPDYGGRGITVCKRWLKFENFLADMGEKPSLTSLDRIDVNKNYEPKNCRWATNIQQANNKRNNLKYRNETAVEASRRLGGCDGLVSNRMTQTNWDIKKAFTAPLRKGV